ncbi:MAG: hypothetical protein V1690_02115 [Candidatus Moraniibacteriota bacterium]
MQANYKLLLFFFFILLTFGSFQVAQAVCPVCTLAVAGGLGISRYVGIDDFISAIWIGGLCLSVTAWGWNYLKSKGKLNSVTGFFVLFLVYFFVLLPLYKLNYIGLARNTIWGIDKILLGTAAGTIVFWLGALTNTLLKKRHEGKAYFPFQKVVIPVAFLIIASLGYYIWCKCYNIF